MIWCNVHTEIRSRWNYSHIPSYATLKNMFHMGSRITVP